MNAVNVLEIVEWKFISTFNIQKSISSIEILKFLIQFPFLDNRSINRNITANFGNEKQMLELLEAIQSFLWPPSPLLDQIFSIYHNLQLTRATHIIICQLFNVKSLHYVHINTQTNKTKYFILSSKDLSQKDDNQSHNHRLLILQLLSEPKIIMPLCWPLCY